MTVVLIAVLAVLQVVIVWRLERHRQRMEYEFLVTRRRIKLADPIKGK